MKNVNMPIPQPQPGEPEEDFTRRCMADDTMRQEYPDLRQRLAVCSAQGKDEQPKNSQYDGKAKPDTEQ